MNASPVALVVESLGWTLLHFVWQGGLIAAALYGFLTVGRGASAQIRYLSACAALLGASAVAALTLAWEIDHVFAPEGAELWATRPAAVADDWAGAVLPSNSNGPQAESLTPIADGAIDLGASGDFEPQDFEAWLNWLRPRLPSIVGLWVVGVGILSLRLLLGWRTIRRLRTSACAIDDPVWIERFGELRRRLGVSRSVRLLASASASVPFVVGWLRPAVLVPAGLLTGLNVVELEAIFAHELAHIRRYDFLVNLLQNVVETLLFYHPAIWWMSAQIRREREHCCDDAAVAACGGALDYAKALVALERLRPATGLMVAASGGSLLARIRRLAGKQDPGRSMVPLAALLLVLGALAALLTVERWTLNAPEVNAIDLPGQSIMGVSELPLRIRIGHDAAGSAELYLDEQRIDEDSLRRLVVDLIQGGADDLPVLVLEDERVSHAELTRVIDLLAELGVHKISHEARRMRGDAEPVQKKNDRTSEENAGPSSSSVSEEPAAAEAAGAAVEANREPVEKLELSATFNGSEIIAWVGPEVILASDVLPDANRLLQKVLDRNFARQTPSQDEIERLRKLYMSKFLERRIEIKLVIVEGKRKLPKEAWGKIEKQFNDQFDKEYLKKMMASEDCTSPAELDVKLRESGSSLEALRGQAMENSFAQHWIDEKTRDDRQVTDEVARDYYETHGDLAATPFADAEAEIRKRIHEDWRSNRRQLYRFKLRKQIPVWNIFETAGEPAENATEIDPNQAAAPESPMRLAIRRDPSGEIGLYLNDQKIDEPTLKRLVAELTQVGGLPAVLLTSDKQVPYGEVMKVIDRLTSLGLHKISLETRHGATGADKMPDDQGNSPSEKPAGGAERSKDRTTEETADRSSNTAAEEPAAAEAGAVAVEADREPVEKPVLPATFNGAEIIARVGPEVILASDVLPDANRQLEKILARAPRTPPQDEIERIRKMYMSKFLDHLIETKLVIVEGKRKLPKEAWGKIEKQFNDQFDTEYLKKMIDTEGCRSRTELDIKLHKNGSSLEALRRQAMENRFAQHWIDEKARDDSEITDEEMHAYYQTHLAAYETPARARWEHLMVRFDNFDTKEQARQAIAGWRRDIQEGTSFGDLATAHSQDISASDGGMHNWTSKDSLLSEVLDDAVFTLPVGQLSRILEDKRRFHVIRVVERNEQIVTPFSETQPEIREQIHEARVREKRQQYRFNLRKTIPVWNIFDAAAGETKAEPAEKPADGAAGQSGKGPAQLDRGDTSINAAKTGPGRPIYPELYRGDVDTPF